MGPLLKLMILLMFWISIMRIRYIWSIYKVDHRAHNLIFRNRDGDLSIILFFLVLLNKPLFDRYKLSYEPILRYFYIIVMGIFVASSILQLTQLVVLTKSGLLTQQDRINRAQLKSYSIRRNIYGYKFKVNYIKKDKEKSLTFVVGQKNKAIVEQRFKKLNVKIV